MAVNRCFKFKNMLLKSHYRADQNVSRDLITLLLNMVGIISTAAKSCQHTCFNNSVPSCRMWWLSRWKNTILDMNSFPFVFFVHGWIILMALKGEKENCCVVQTKLVEYFWYCKNTNFCRYRTLEYNRKCGIKIKRAVIGAS